MSNEGCIRLQDSKLILSYFLLRNCVLIAAIPILPPNVLYHYYKKNTYIENKVATSYSEIHHCM